MKKTWGPVFCVLLAGMIWGCMGLFTRNLNAVGLYAMEVVEIRVIGGALFSGLYLLLFHREQLKIRPRDLWCFVGTGICSLLGFSWCYFTGMTVASLSVMAVLLYTAPVFVMLMSLILFRERLTAVKLLALGLSFAGCCLASGLGTASALSRKGLLLGLGAGFCFSLYSIFSRYAIRRGYASLTITFYTFVACALGSAPLCVWPRVRQALAQPDTLAWSAGMALTTGFLAYILYTKGLEGMESSRASILASVEPVVATVIGAAVFHESLTWMNLLGVALVLAAIAVLSLPQKA